MITHTTLPGRPASGPTHALTLAAVVCASAVLSVACCRADMVTEWNANYFKAAKVAAQLPPGYPSFTYDFTRFSDAAAQVKEARIWAGIHFRNSTHIGGEMGVALADYVLDHVMRPLADDGQGAEQEDN